MGQDNAIQAISSVIVRPRTGINDPNKPIGSFIFRSYRGRKVLRLLKLFLIIYLKMKRTNYY